MCVGGIGVGGVGRKEGGSHPNLKTFRSNLAFKEVVHKHLYMKMCFRRTVFKGLKILAFSKKVATFKVAC